MPTALLSASWGRIRLFCEEMTTDGSRTQVVHRLSSGSLHPTQDRGRRERRVRCKLQFDHFPGSPPPIEAAAIMEAAVASGASAMFQHPTLGRYLASVGEFTWTIDSSSVISADAEFIQEDADQAVTPTGAGSSAVAGEISVAAAATALDAELANVGALKMSGPTLGSLLSSMSATLSASLGVAAGFSFELSDNAAVDLSVDLSVQLLEV